MAEASDKALLNTWIWSPNGHMASLTEGTVLIDYLFPRKRLIAANLAVITFLVALLTFVIWLFLGSDLGTEGFWWVSKISASLFRDTGISSMQGVDKSPTTTIELLFFFICLGSAAVTVLLWVTNKILTARLPNGLRYRQCTIFADSDLTVAYYGAQAYKVMTREKEDGLRPTASLLGAINDFCDQITGLYRGNGPTYRHPITKLIKKVTYSWNEFASFSVQPEAIVLWRTDSPPQNLDSPCAQKDIEDALVIRMDPEQINYLTPILQNYLTELPPNQTYVIPDPSFTTMPYSMPIKLLGMDLVGDCSRYMDELPLRIPQRLEETPPDPLRLYVAEPSGPYNTQPDITSESTLGSSSSSRPQGPAGLTARDIENAYRHRF